MFAEYCEPALPALAQLALRNADKRLALAWLALSNAEQNDDWVRAAELQFSVIPRLEAERRRRLPPEKTPRSAA
jgi:hypothetical protein